MFLWCEILLLAVCSEREREKDENIPIENLVYYTHRLNVTGA